MSFAIEYRTQGKFDQGDDHRSQAGCLIERKITDIPYIRRKHHKLDPAVSKRESVGSLANCPACHISAEKGIYDDDDVKVPK